MRPVQSLWMLIAVFLAFRIIAAEPPSVNDVMVSIITPATDTIWQIEDPQTDEEWQVYVDAAAQVLDAATRIKSGGSGPNDSNWAQDPRWQQFADVLIESAKKVKAAAEQHDLDTLVDVSNEVMYPPCEECHLMFHPGLQQQEVN